MGISGIWIVCVWVRVPEGAPVGILVFVYLGMCLRMRTAAHPLSESMYWAEETLDDKQGEARSCASQWKAIIVTT